MSRATPIARLRELVHGPAGADIGWLVMRAAILFPAAAEVLFDQPLKTKGDRAFAVEIALEAIEEGYQQEAAGC